MNTNDMITAVVLGALVILMGAGYLYSALRNDYEVAEGHVGALYHKGKLITILPAGRHVRWGNYYRLVALDARKTLLHVQGQEVLTADNVSVKVSLVLTTQIVDAAAMLRTVDNHINHLYTLAQTALRAAVAGYSVEALLSQRTTLGTQLLDLIAPGALRIGIKIHTVDVRDLMLPGELRKAFSESLKARQEGQAALERARAESASLRNLANAARLLEGQPALATLRLLQTLESRQSGQTLVMNDVQALLTAMQQTGAKTAG